ncbi:hypothetical protein [Campylobacter sp.]|uniref:hypothetical protein n=1 Tax=Campylobacter sp. TaxID=205 RepID=UPI0026DA82F0|nr:hypothetical protein [Campylobacter sp.]MDO4674403.1 hypothetical protein [Campylobacter sp.]
MAIKIFGILLALFSIIFTFVGLQEPFVLNFKSYALDFKNMEAKNLSVHELDASGVKSYYQAGSWARYAGRDVLENFINHNADFNVSADTLELVGEERVILEGNVSYVGEGLRFSSARVQYYPKQRRIHSDANFRALVDENIIDGTRLDYDMERKILELEGVSAWLAER